MQINSPFKFLDAFTEADKDVFFGRDKEVEQLYESVNKNRLVLVYGQSGTGKTSLVQCGLAAKFDVTDWYPIFVRRQGNINESLQNELQKVAKKSYRPDPIATLERLNTKFLRPVFLIFDQFEELLILGDYEKEQLPFAQTLKSLLEAPELACHIILIFREEYIASLYPFERTIPQLLDRRLRVERMSRKNVEKVILNSCVKFNIELEKGTTAANLIIDNLSGERAGIPLPYLQVYLDLLYREDYEKTYPDGNSLPRELGENQNENQKKGTTHNNSIESINSISEKLPSLTFTLEEITDFGKIENVLEKFLNEQNDALQSLVKKQYPAASANVVRQTLDVFVTEDGTKQPLLYRLENKQILLTSNAPEHLRQLPTELCTLLLQELENRRLLRRTETTFELAHDSLADLIDQQRTDEQRQLNDIKRRIRSSFAEYQQTHEFLSRKQLTAYEDFISKLQLNPQLQKFLADSRTDVEQREQEEKQRQERELQLVKEKLEIEQNLTKIAEEEKQKAQAIIRSSLANELAFKAELALKDGNRTEAFQLAAFAELYVDSNNHKVQQQLFNAWYYNELFCRNKFLSLPPVVFLQKTLGHSDSVNGIAFSLDGRKVATASSDKTAKIWDLETGKELLSLTGHSNSVNGIAFSLDGCKVATASSDKTAKIWDLETGKELLTLTGHRNLVLGIAFSPDGRKVATVSSDYTAKIWYWETGGEVLTLVGHSSKVNGVAFSPNGRKIATASSDKTAKIWEVKTGKRILTLKGHSKSVNDIAFSPDGRKVATVSSDKTAKIWEVETGKKIWGLKIGKELLTLKGHSDSVNGITFSPDGRKVATASWDKTAKIWDLETGKEIPSLTEHRNLVLGIAFSPDGRKVATASSDKTAKLWDLQIEEEILTLTGHRNLVLGIAFSPDGRKVATTASGDTTAKIWDLETGKESFTLSGHILEVNGIAFSPDGRKVATASSDKTSKLWGLKMGKEILTLVGHSSEVNGIAFSPDGRKVATVSNDKTAKIWDLGRGKEIFTLTGHSSEVNGITFSPDGRKVATHSRNKTGKIWDLEMGVEVLTLSDLVLDIAFSPNGRKVATASSDKTAKIWDLETGKEVLTLTGHNSEVNGIAISSSGHKVATVSRGETVKIWDLETGKELLTLTGHNETIYDIAFSPDGHTIATTSGKTAKIWEVTCKGILQKAANKYALPDYWNPILVEQNELAFAMENGFGLPYFLQNAHAQSLYGMGQYYQNSVQNLGVLEVVEQQLKKAEQCFRRAADLDGFFQKDLEEFLKFKEEKLKGME